MDSEEKITVTMVQGKCQHCKKVVAAPNGYFEKAWEKHLESCEPYKTLVEQICDFHNKGVLQPYMRMLRKDGLEKAMRRLIRKYKATTEELMEILEGMEE